MADYSPDEKLIKRPTDDSPLSDDEAREWLKCAESFDYFCANYMMVQGEKGRVLFCLRDYQEKVIQNSMENRYTISLLSRQVGKTVLFAAYILWKMIFIEDFQAAISSYKNINVLDFISRIGFGYQCLPWWLKVPCVKFNQFSIAFNNGSSVYGQVTNETFGRGKSLNLVVLDELAFVDAKISNILMGSLMGSLSANGEHSQTELHVISTPNGTQGAFYEIWSNAILGDSEFSPMKIEYEEVPGRGPDENGVDKFQDKMLRAGMSRDVFDQEFRLFFISSSGTLINSRKLESIKASPVVREDGDLEIFVDSFKGRKIGITCDPAEGISEDYSCMQFFDIETFEQVAEYKNNMVNHTQLVKHLIRYVKMIRAEGAIELYFCYESNGIGAGLSVLLENINDPDFNEVMIISDQTRISKGKTGMVTTNKSKLEACGKFKDLVETDKLYLKSQRLLNELKTFVKKGASFAAESGNHDDLVSGCLLFVRMLDELRNYDEGVDDVVSTISLDTEEDFSDIFF